MNHNRSRYFPPDISDDKVLGNIVLGEEEEGRHWEIFQFSVNIKLSYTRKRKRNTSYKKNLKLNERA